MEDGRDVNNTSSASHHINNRAAMEQSTPAELARPTGNQPLTQNQDSDSDASSAMDVSDSDQEQEPQPEPEPHMPQPRVNGAQSAGAKRKMGDVTTNGSSHTVHALPKKPRLSPPPSPQATNGTTLKTSVQKPPEPRKLASQRLREETKLCQHIFQYLPPAILSRCLRVCKDFNAYLTNTQADGVKTKKKDKDSPASTFDIRVMDSNDIWANARKTWFPNMPRPLARITELQMLQLVGGHTCQTCHRKPVPFVATSVFNAGPGHQGVRVIWPFHIRTCGSCLQNDATTDVSFLKTSYGFLAPGLPYIFMTSDWNFIPEIQRQAPGGMPAQPGTSISKAYYRHDMDHIIAEFEGARELGADEEWRKGLFAKGKEAMADAARWEKWEAQMRPGSDLSQALREYDLSSFPNYLAEAQRRSATSAYEPPAATGYGTSPSHALPPTPQFAQPVHSTQAGPSSQNGGPRSTPMPAAVHAWPAQHIPRPARNPEDVEERRQARRLEIERRCLDLSPPLDAAVLPFIESFQAAMQIAQPLTDQAWEMLKPRILAQREVAELDAHNRAAQYAALQASIPSYNAADPYLKPAKEEIDMKVYNAAQEPLRRRLVEYVDEYVNTTWNGNARQDYDTSPIFAAKSILYIHQRYKEDEAAGLIPRAGPAPNAGRRQGSLPTDPFLSLENMKWVFVNKIKVCLDDSCHDLFVCAGCLEDHPSKIVKKPFEGLIQHYGAKHTSAFSRRNIIVHWQEAPWPEDSPFSPQPENYFRPSNRRTSGHRGRGNAKNTPQPRRDAMFNAPATGSHFSNQYSPYSNGYNGGAQGYTPHTYGQSNHLAASYDQYQGYGQAAPQPQDAPDVLENKIKELATNSREVFDALEGVDGKVFLTCVRVHTVIHHARSRFVDKFGTAPTLDHFTDALATNPAMQPIKTALGLACKQCVASQTDGSGNDPSYFTRVRNVKLFNFSSLINHFKLIHLPNMPGANWTEVMLELPETQMIKDLPLAHGMDENKLGLILAAFPDAFPDPQVRIEDFVQGKATGASSGAPAGMASKTTQRSQKGKGPTQGQKKKKKGKNGAFGVSGSREGSQDGPQAHEYDPRMPMNATMQDDEDDAARFDTDIARKKASTSAAPMETSAFDFTPETLRALQAMTLPQTPTSAPPMQPGYASGSRSERAPSVGRNEYDAPAAPPAPPPPSAHPSNLQPDIAAILASLTGGVAQQPQQQQVVTPPAGAGGREATVSRSAPHDSGLDQLYRSLSTSYNAPARYPEPPHQAPPQPPQYRPSMEPPTPGPRYKSYNAPGQDLQAALERNARHFAQNQAPPPPPQAYAQAPALGTHHVAPPRYQYAAYDYGQPAPVQYIQRAPAPSHPQGYAAAQPPPRTVYVDESGREIMMLPADGYYEQPQGHYGGWAQGGR